MNEAREAWIRALEESADALEKVVGTHELPGPYNVEGMCAMSSDKNFVPKWKLVHHVEGFRHRAAKLRRNDVKQGDWPPFLPDEATRYWESLDLVEAQLAYDSPNEILRTAVKKALKPLRDVIAKYGVHVDGVWRFKGEDADEIPPFPTPPPDPNLRYR